MPRLINNASFNAPIIPYDLSQQTLPKNRKTIVIYLNTTPTSKYRSQKATFTKMIFLKLEKKI